MANMRQASLLATGHADVPCEIGRLERTDYGHGSWIDHRSNWLPGADAWLDELKGTLRWNAASRPMYDRIVEVPRLTSAFIRGADHVPTNLERLATRFDRHYGRSFPGVGCNWYRDGNDSVAWHADRVQRPGDSIIAIIGVGERRPFLIRPSSGGRSIRWRVGDGDLVVLGGTFQAHWHHAVPKVATAGDRISIMFRG